MGGKLNSSELELDGKILAICKLFDGIKDCQFWIKDVQGRFVWVNGGFLQSYHLNRREEAIGKKEIDLCDPHLADQHAIDDALVFLGKPVINRVEKIGSYDHTAIWSLTTKIPLVDHSGQIDGLAGIAMPLSQQEMALNPSSFALGNLIAYIRSNFAEPLTNRQLARIAHMSVRTLDRSFNAAFSVSPQQYIKQMRVRMSCHALSQTNQSIASIATSHGFSDQGNFIRNFRQFMGETPSKYRKNHRLRDGVAIPEHKLAATAKTRDSR